MEMVAPTADSPCAFSLYSPQDLFLSLTFTQRGIGITWHKDASECFVTFRHLNVRASTQWLFSLIPSLGKLWAEQSAFRGYVTRIVQFGPF